MKKIQKKEDVKKIALITAAGIGSRVGQDIPKQFLNVYDKPIIMYTLECFQNHPEIDAIVVVCLKGWENVLEAYIKQFNIDTVLAKDLTDYETNLKNAFIETEKEIKAEIPN